MWLVTRRSWTLIQRFDDGEQRDQLRRPGAGQGRAGSGRRDRTKGAVICRRSVGSCTQDGQQNAGGDADDDVLDRATDRAAPRRVA